MDEGVRQTKKLKVGEDGAEKSQSQVSFLQERQQERGIILVKLLNDVICLFNNVLKWILAFEGIQVKNIYISKFN